MTAATPPPAGTTDAAASAAAAARWKLGSLSSRRRRTCRGHADSSTAPVAVQNPVVLLVEPKNGQVIHRSRCRVGTPMSSDGKDLAGRHGRQARTAVGARITRSRDPEYRRYDQRRRRRRLRLGDRPGHRSVLRIDPATSRSSTRSAKGNGANAALFGADPSVVNQTDGTVSRIDTTQDKVTKTIPVGEVRVRSPLAPARSGSPTRSERSPASMPIATCRSLRSRLARRRPRSASAKDPLGRKRARRRRLHHSSIARVLSTTAIGQSGRDRGGRYRVWLASTAAHLLIRLTHTTGMSSDRGGLPVGLGRLGTLAVTALPASVTHRGGIVVTGHGSDPTLDPATWWCRRLGLTSATNDGLSP
jgi:hypothetical protein